MHSFCTTVVVSSMSGVVQRICVKFWILQATVLSDQIGPANEVGLVFQDGEWQIRDSQSRPGSFAASPQRVPASPIEQLSLEG